MEILRISLEQQSKYCDKAFNIAKNPGQNGYQRGIFSMFYKFFEKMTSCETVKNENFANKDLHEELHKPFIRNFNKRKLHL